MSYFGDAVVKAIKEIRKSIGADKNRCFEQLYKMTANHLRNVAVFYLDDKSLADDVVSESFVRVIVYIDSANEDRDGYNWLCKIVENEARRMNQKYRRESVGLPINHSDEASESNFRAYLEQMEDKNRIESAISKCSEDMQDLYTLRYRCNKTYQEIGELKRISAPAVVKRVQKLNEFIRKELASSDAD